MELVDDAPAYGCGIHEDAKVPCVICASIHKQLAEECVDHILRLRKSRNNRRAKATPQVPTAKARHILHAMSRRFQYAR